MESEELESRELVRGELRAPRPRDASRDERKLALLIAQGSPADAAELEPERLSARTLRELPGPGPVRTLWTSLQHHPWGDLGFHERYLAHDEGFVRPHVVLVEDDGAAVGLLAGTLRDEAISWRLGSLTALRSRARILKFTAGGILGVNTPHRARVAAEEVLASLARGEADAAYLHEVERETPLLAELERLGGSLQRDRSIRPVTGWVLDLPDSFQTFRAGLSKKTRANLNYTINLIRRRLGAELALACYQRPEELERLLADTETIAAKTYHRRAGVGFAQDPATRRMLEHALAAGWLRAHVLYAGTRPIAFSHGHLYRRTFHGRHTGFDPEFAELRPGVYLVAQIIEELCAERAAERMDFGVMDNEFKRSFASQSYERVSAYVFAPSWKGLRLALARTTVGALDRGTRALLGAERARRMARRLASAGMIRRGKG